MGGIRKDPAHFMELTCAFDVLQSERVCAGLGDLTILY